MQEESIIHTKHTKHIMKHTNQTITCQQRKKAERALSHIRTINHANEPNNQTHDPHYGTHEPHNYLWAKEESNASLVTHMHHQSYKRTNQSNTQPTQWNTRTKQSPVSKGRKQSIQVARTAARGAHIKRGVRVLPRTLRRAFLCNAGCQNLHMRGSM